MELNDNEFDATFRKKVFDADPQFEDAAWDKMERKLKRRDRVVFFRKAALVLLVLLSGVWGYYSIDKMPSRENAMVVTKKGKIVSPRSEISDAGNKAHSVSDSAVANTEVIDQMPEAVAAGAIRSSRNNSKARVDIPVEKSGPYKAGLDIERRLHGETLAALRLSPAGAVADTISVGALPFRHVVLKSVQFVPGKKGIKVKRNLPVSLAISAGPEFNTASSVVGGDPGFNAGLTLGFGISRRLDLQAGVRYSLKKYNSGAGVKYNFPEMSNYVKNNFTGLDASCDVLEIPIQASYNVMRKGLSSVNLNAGISSYIMLKEDYTLKYNTPYGQTSWDLQKRNSNKHLLSIVDLSATYFVKVQHTNLKVGLEPFVKIPLTGVGEGNINLKSSGISLKLRYDLDKKNN